MEKTGFFEEAPGQRSWMRLATSVIILNALMIMNYQVLISSDHSFNFAQVSFLILTALGGKIWQKSQELTAESKEKPPDNQQGT